VHEQLEIRGKKKWLEEDDMGCKVCVPGEAISDTDMLTQQSASEESGSEESGSEESGSEESSSEESAYDDETTILTESSIVEKGHPPLHLQRKVLS
jgi:aerobic-type carbon monoxide dehydrogenase small subunit (CoxS/CutS family)